MQVESKYRKENSIFWKGNFYILTQHSRPICNNGNYTPIYTKTGILYFFHLLHFAHYCSFFNTSFSDCIQGSGKWYELQDLHVADVLSQMIPLSESYVQVITV